MAMQIAGNPPVQQDSVNATANGGTEIPSTTDPSKKLRILCIHGFRTSGKILDQQIQMANWHRLMGDIAEFHFMDGPWPAGGKSEVEKIFDGPYYEWYRSSPDFLEVTGVEGATSHFLNYLALNEPFDGLLGFSQGGVLAAVWIGLSEKGLGPKMPNIKFLIEIGGGRGKAKVFQPAYDGNIQSPSIHFFGDRDKFKSFGEELVPVFKDPVVINHQYGHVVPKLSASEAQIFRDFLLKQLEAKPAS